MHKVLKWFISCQLVASASGGFIVFIDGCLSMQQPGFNSDGSSCLLGHWPFTSATDRISSDWLLIVTTKRHQP